MSKIKGRDYELFILDILIAIKKIETYVQNFNNAEELKYDILHWDATIRELEIIGEALNNLFKNSTFKENSEDYFKSVISFRNKIVHEYFGIDEDEIWGVVTKHIFKLYKDIIRIIDIQKIDLTQFIEYEKQDYQNMKDQTIYKFLCNLEIDSK